MSEIQDMQRAHGELQRSILALVSKPVMASGAGGEKRDVIKAVVPRITAMVLCVMGRPFKRHFQPEGGWAFDLIDMRRAVKELGDFIIHYRPPDASAVVAQIKEITDFTRGHIPSDRDAVRAELQNTIDAHEAYSTRVG